MSIKYKIPLVLIFSFNLLSASSLDGEKIFKQYCWGCHHETSVAFGPSFPGQKGIAHKENEYFVEADLKTNLIIYALAIYKLCLSASGNNTRTD